MSMQRVVGLGGAVGLGLGSIVGAGVFVSLGLAAGLAGPWLIVCLALAAAVATCNGLSSAQLAASHPVSGGSYEYGIRWLHPAAGFLAGWMFLCAKSAAAATAALGLAGYLLALVGLEAAGGRVALAIGAVGAVTALVAGGITRSARANAVVVSITLLCLVAFVLCGLPSALAGAPQHLDFGASAVTGRDFLQATALVFVAYTGYGRIATLGEEVREPQRTIPRAIALTLAVSAFLYAGVAAVALGSAGAPELARLAVGSAAPLAPIAVDFGVPGLPALVAVGAATALVGVLLNLVLGLSRVWLAMARRGDMPSVLAGLDAAGSPRAAVLASGAVAAALALSDSVRLTWSFSAFSVLVYYALTNAAALRLAPEQRLFPRAVSWAGLVACLGLACFVEPAVWAAGVALAALGLAWHAWRRRSSPAPPALD